MNNKMYTQQMTDLAHHTMNRIKELEHRLAMVKEDSLELQKFIAESGLDELFQNSTNMCDEAWSHFANIDIACDLNSSEALDWKKFNQPKVYEVGIDEGDEIGTHTIATFTNEADAKAFMTKHLESNPTAELFIDTITSDFLK
jgi:hypothetical protein